MSRPPISQAIVDLYDEYTHAPLDRRVFLGRLSRLAGGTAAATAVLALLENDYARAATVPEDDSSLATEEVDIEAPGGPVSAYVAKPVAADDALPAVIVIHENRGLNPHIKDVARRAALAGYVAIAPDFLSPDGGTPEDEDQARAMIGELNPDTTLQNALAVVDYARANRDDVTGKVGAIGFCWGGGLVNRIAVEDPELNAAVPFYGRQPPAEAAAKIQAPLQLHYAGMDERINAGIEDYVAALEAAGVPYEMHLYEGANHAFHNDTNAARYDQAAAELAWQRTLDFLKQHLEG